MKCKPLTILAATMAFIVAAFVAPLACATTVYANPSVSGSAFCGGGSTANLGFISALPGNAVTAFTFGSAGSQFGGGVVNFAIFSDPSYSNLLQSGSLGFFIFGFPGGGVSNYAVFVSGFLPSGYWQVSIGAFCAPAVSTASYSGLTIDEELPPPGTTALGQFVANGTTPLAQGGVTTGTTVVFSASIQASTSTDALQFQVEVQPSANGFSGNPTAVASSSEGQSVTVTVSGLQDGSYHWAARVFDPVTHAATPWQTFSSSTIDFVVADALVPTSPTVLTDATTIYSAGNGFVGGCCPNFVMSPGPVFYHAPTAFAIQSIVVDDTDFSSNNHDGVGNIRASIYDLHGNLIARSTNTIYGESGCTGCGFAFSGEAVPQDFQLSLVVEDAIQGDGGFTVRNLRFSVVPSAPPSISDFSPTSGNQGQMNLTVSVTGTNFQSTSVLVFSNQGVSVGSYSQRTATQIIAMISISNDAQSGPTDVTVTNPDGQTSTMAQAFIVIAVTPPSQRDLGGQKQQQSTAEPVSTGTGNYHYQHTDFTVPGRGSPLMFEPSYNTLDNYQGPLGANWTHTYNITLTQVSNGTVAVKWGDGHIEVFTSNSSEYLPEPGVYNTLSKNGDGSFTLVTKDQTHYSFSAVGKLTACTDRNGNATTLGYDRAGNLIKIVDPGGRTLALTYDSSDRITAVTDPAGRSESFAYDLNDNLVQTTDPAGGVTTFAYDGNHHVLTITLPNGNTLLQNTYDTSGRVLAQTNGLGRTWTFAYGVPNTTDTTVTDARGDVTIHTYDALLRVVKVKDSLGGTVTFAYDGSNNRTSITNQNGNKTSFSYDSQGNISAIKDSNGNVSTFNYDTRNDLLNATDAKGNATTFGYDSNGNLTSIQNALGHTTTFAHDGFGQLISKKDAAGNTTSYAYDSFGNLTSVTDALGHTTKLGYDAIGRLIATTDGNGHTAHASYDTLSHLAAVTDALNHRTEFSYDPVGNLLTITDADRNATNYAYDAVNNLLAVTDALGHLTKYSYDENNNRTGFTNAKGNTTLYTYDLLNRLSTITDPLTFVTAYTYDGLGNVVAVRDANGNTNRFAYDALNRLIAISYGNGMTVAYSFDANGNRTVMTDAHGTTTYAYDVLNRLTSVLNPGGKTVQYQYNAIGNRQSVTYPDGKVVNYAYDPVNHLSQVQDWLGRVTNYQYDPAGNLISLTFPNQAGISFTYDNANRLTGVTNSFLKPGGMDDKVSHHFGIFQYSLDAVGNRLQVSNGRGKVIRYSYDKLYELIGVSTEPSGDDNDDQDDTGINATYAYDAVGNRISTASSRGVVSYFYDAGDRLLQAGTASYTYDANGNQTSVTKTASTSTIAFRYDAANRLIAVTGGAVNSSFLYDGDGNRIGQSARQGTFSYVNDIASALPVVLQESGADGDISFAYGLNLISESGTGFDNFYQYDGLGSVVGLTDSQGRVTQRYTYDAWGKTLRTIPALQNRALNEFRFTGEALDSGTGLYFLRARYYDPMQGRFLNHDPFPGIATEPLSVSKYLYVLNRPVTLTDPSGLAAEKPLGTMDFLLPMTGPAPVSNNAATTVAVFPSKTDHSSNATTAIIAGVCSTVGVFQTIFEETANFLSGLTINGIASGGGQQAVSDVPCYSNLPGPVGLFFSSVSTAK